MRRLIAPCLCLPLLAACNTIRQVEIRTSADNLRSRRVAELAGFRCERTIVADGRHPDGSSRDTVVYAAYPPME